jgi:hypothetical protein
MAVKEEGNRYRALRNAIAHPTEVGPGRKWFKKLAETLDEINSIGNTPSTIWQHASGRYMESPDGLAISNMH